MDSSINMRVEWDAAELLNADPQALAPAGRAPGPGEMPQASADGIAYSLQSAHFCSILGQIESLAGLPPLESDELARISEFRRYAPGAHVFRQGERIPGIFVVIRGALKVSRSSGRGKVQVLAILQPGTCVGEVQAFDGAPIASSAEAMGDTDCWLIPGEVLRSMVRTNAVVREVLIRHFAGKVRHLITLVGTLGLHSVPERVAQLLVDQIHQNEGELEVRFRETQEELAQRVGAGREAFSRSLRLLAGLELIHSVFPRVRVLDLEKLKRFAQG